MKTGNLFMEKEPQNMSLFDLVPEGIARWKHVGEVQGLGSDSDIAFYLLQLYDDSVSGQVTGTWCSLCHTKLILMCPQCQTAQQCDSTKQRQLTLPQNSVKGQLQEKAEADRPCNSCELPALPTFEESQLKEASEYLTECSNLLNSMQKNETQQSTHCGDDSDNEINEFEDSEDHNTVCSESFEDSVKLHSINTGAYGSDTVDHSITASSESFEDSVKLHSINTGAYGSDTVDHSITASSESFEDSVKLHSINTGAYGSDTVDRNITASSESFEDSVKLHSINTGAYGSDTVDRNITASSEFGQQCVKMDVIGNDAYGEESGPTDSTNCEEQELKRDTKEPHPTRRVRRTVKRKHRTVECLKCSMTFFSQHDLQTHRETHKPKRQYVCPKCEKRFTYHASFNSHLQLHGSQEMFKCGHCQQTFAEAKTLKHHAMVHTDFRNYVCGLCGQKFHDLDWLKIHVRKKCMKLSPFTEGKKPRDLALFESGVQKTWKETEPLSAGEYVLNEAENSRQCEDAVLLHSEVASLASFDSPDTPTLDRDHILITGSTSFQISSVEDNLWEANMEEKKSLQQGSSSSTIKKQPQGRLWKPKMDKNKQRKRSSRECKGTKSSVHCPQCGSHVSRARDLKIHMRIHTGEKPYECSKCKKAFRHRASFTLHLARQCCNGRKDPDKECPKKDEHQDTASDVDLFLHIQEQQQPCFPSSKDKDCADEDDGRKRDWDGKNTGEQEVSCDRDLVLPSLHLEVLESAPQGHVHQNFDGDEKHQTSSDRHSSLSHPQNLFTEDQCVFGLDHNLAVNKVQSYDSSSSGLQHNGQGRNPPPQSQSSVPGVLESKEDLHNEHNLTSHQPRGRRPVDPSSCVSCHVCGVKISRQRDLKIHMRIHSGEKPYLCSECGAEFRQAAGLFAHNLRKHSGQRPYVCDQCGSSFPLVGSLNQHMRIHNEVKGHTCPKCGKSFLRSSDLKGHIARHLGIKQFPCEDCSKTFCTSSELAKHKTLHTGEKPYICSECRKAFRLHRSLKRHMQTHMRDRPWQCVECK